jgi:myosin heavy subunit
VKHFGAACRPIGLFCVFTFQFEGDESSRITELSTLSLATASKLLVLDQTELEKVLTTRRLDVSGSVVEKNLTPKQVQLQPRRLKSHSRCLFPQWPDHACVCQPLHHVHMRVYMYAQAKHTRNALAKHVYGKMFDWIVVRTNNFLGEGEARSGESFVGT